MEGKRRRKHGEKGKKGGEGTLPRELFFY